ncbi:quinol:cytochrome C oxidoreductase, partial [bacterium]|nr:quinol:cytochrome C oxidoreductase [bacterium]
LSFIYYRGSVKQDKSGDKKITRRLQNLSGPGIILTALTLTFAAFDWIMSLDPHWYSTIYGVYYFSGSLVAIFAFLSISIIAMQSAGLLEGVVTTEHYHDLGKLLFGFTVFWTYIAFSQYFLIWYANIPEETLWYAHRSVGSWQKMTTFMAVGHFVLPFFYFLTRSTKRHRFALLVGAMWMLMMHFIDMYWLVAPSLHHEGVVFGLIDVTTLLGIGGLFLAFFTWNLRRNPLVPIKDPRLQESLRFENF